MMRLAFSLLISTMVTSAAATPSQTKLATELFSGCLQSFDTAFELVLSEQTENPDERMAVLGAIYSDMVTCSQLVFDVCGVGAESLPRSCFDSLGGVVDGQLETILANLPEAINWTAFRERSYRHALEQAKSLPELPAAIADMNDFEAVFMEKVLRLYSARSAQRIYLRSLKDGQE